MSALTITVLGLLTATLNIVRTVLGRLTRPSARQRAEKAAHDARAASALGDARAVNAAVERERLKASLPVAIILLCGATLLAGCGCSLLRGTAPPPPDDLPPAIVIIPADRYQYPMTNDAGVAGWFVPLAVHTEMLEAVALVDYYRSQSTPKGHPKP